MLFSIRLFAQEADEQIPTQTLEEPKSQPATPPTVETQSILIKERDSITTLIEQVKVSKVEEKRVLMNQLKVQLRQMNKENRQKVMMELKQSFATNSQNQQKHQYSQNLQEQQAKHQPKHRQLRNGQGVGATRENHQGNSNR